MAEDIDSVIDSVGVVVLQGSSVLLFDHGSSAKHPTGAVGLPAGRVEPGETKQIAAGRELKEEAGLIAHNLYPLPKTYQATLRWNGRDQPFRFFPYLCTSYSGEVSACKEGKPIWVELRQVSDYELIGDGQEVIQDAIKLRVLLGI